MDRHSLFEKKNVMVLTALFCCLIWGSAFSGIKLSYIELNINNEFQMILLAGLRFALAGFGVLIFTAIKRRGKCWPTRKEMPLILLIAVVQTFGAYTAYYIGFSHTTAVKGSILTSVSVFFVAILSHLIFKSDKLNWKKIMGLLLGFIGVILVNLTIVAGTQFAFSLSGEGLIILHALLIALSAVLVRRSSGKIDVIKLNGWQLFIGGLMMIVVGYAGHPEIIRFTWFAGALLVHLAAISAVAFSLWFLLLKYHEASTVEQYKFTVPLFGSVMSVIFIPGEHIGIEMLAAAVLVAVGIIIVNRQERAR